MNSFSLEKNFEVGENEGANIELEDSVLSRKSNVNASGDSSLEDDECDVTVREVKREDERMEVISLFIVQRYNCH